MLIFFDCIDVTFNLQYTQSIALRRKRKILIEALAVKYFSKGLAFSAVLMKN